MNDEPREIFAASIQLRHRAERGVKALLKRRSREGARLDVLFIMCSAPG